MSDRIRRVLHRGSRVECPLCERTFSRFAPARDGRRNAVCPGCGSEARHRALWLYLNERTNLRTAPLDLLHLGTEPALERRLRTIPNIAPSSGDPRAHDDGSFDAIVCSDVLADTEEDRARMREMPRVLRAGGWAVLLVTGGFPDELRAAGWNVEVDTWVRELPAERRERHALSAHEDLHVGRKPA